MTPAKLLVLLSKQRDTLALMELPITRFMSMYYNMNRSPGDQSKGIQPAPAMMPDQFASYSRRKRITLAAKDGPGGHHVLHGAKTDRGAWESWVAKKSQTVVRVKK